jgi:hypothetical protein
VKDARARVAAVTSAFEARKVDAGEMHKELIYPQRRTIRGRTKAVVVIEKVDLPCLLFWSILAPSEIFLYPETEKWMVQGFHPAGQAKAC